METQLDMKEDSGELQGQLAVITIRVEGGVIQEVESVPRGVAVRVLDYDNGKEAECETTDSCGNPCSVDYYTEENS